MKWIAFEHRKNFWKNILHDIKFVNYLVNCYYVVLCQMHLMFTHKPWTKNKTIFRNKKKFTVVDDLVNVYSSAVITNFLRPNCKITLTHICAYTSEVKCLSSSYLCWRSHSGVGRVLFFQSFYIFWVSSWYGSNILSLIVTKRQCGKEDGLKDKISYHLNAFAMFWNQNCKTLHTFYDSFGQLLWYWTQLRGSWFPFLLLTLGSSCSRC